MLRPAERQVLAGLQSPVVAIGDDGCIAHAGAGVLRAAGWDASLIGQSVRALIPPSRQEPHREVYGHVAVGRWPAQGLAPQRAFVAQDGTARILHSQAAVFQRPDGSRLVCGTLTDDPTKAGLEELALAMGALGYKRLLPSKSGQLEG